MSIVSGKNVLLGVTAGIAAYKTAHLVRLFIKAGAHVQVIMTPAAKDFDFKRFLTDFTFIPSSLVGRSRETAIIKPVNSSQANSPLSNKYFTGV